jgi:hypothetical protein
VLEPGDQGTIGIHIYVFNVEYQQPVGGKAHFMYAVTVKPHGPGREDTPIYIVIFETPRLVGVRNTSCTHLLQKPNDPGRQGSNI